MKIDWAYLRKGRTSCTNAQEFFGRKQVTIEEVVDARKEALDADRAWALLQVSRAVSVAKGKGFVRFDQVAKQKD